jgi:hypothetical protein
MNQNDHAATLSIDERINAIEASLGGTPGTMLKRCLKEKQGYEWVLGLGGMQMPKTEFRGETIDDVVAQGEKAIAEMKAKNMGRLPNGWDALDETFGTSSAPSM